MVNLAMQEILAILQIRHVKGAALTPRHQGKVERSHQNMMRSHLLLMNKMTNAFPQEWASLIPALEYIYATAPQGRHGFSAEDMSTGYALLSACDHLLAPFQVPEGMAEQDTAASCFHNFKELYSIFTKCIQEEAVATQMRVNETRRPRRLDPGDIVFWQVPHGARLNKHLFPEPSARPYKVKAQPTTTSVILEHVDSGLPVNEGRTIPLDQIIAGLVRAQLAFDTERSEVRALSAMINELSGGPSADTAAAAENSRTEARRSGQLLRGGRAITKKASLRTGWEMLGPGSMIAYKKVSAGPAIKEVEIGRVSINDDEHKRVIVQPYKAIWSGVDCRHVPLYQTRNGLSEDPQSGNIRLAAGFPRTHSQESRRMGPSRMQI